MVSLGKIGGNTYFCLEKLSTESYSDVSIACVQTITIKTLIEV